MKKRRSCVQVFLLLVGIALGLSQSACSTISIDPFCDCECTCINPLGGATLECLSVPAGETCSQVCNQCSSGESGGGGIIPPG